MRFRYGIQESSVWAGATDETTAETSIKARYNLQTDVECLVGTNGPAPAARGGVKAGIEHYMIYLIAPADAAYRTRLMLRLPRGF